MFLASKLRKLITGAEFARGGRRRRSHRMARLRVEQLEDRTLLSAGALDLTFGTGGSVTTDFTGGDDEGNAVAVQADGKIVVAGYAYRGGSSSYYDFALVRYNADGSLDIGFGSGGKVVTAFSNPFSVANGVAIQGDGKIVAAGTSGQAFALARYLADGTLDASFDGDGKLTTEFSSLDDRAYGVAVQADGKIVAAGYADTRNGSNFALARYNANGSLDKTFGKSKSGKVTTDFGGGGDTAYSIVVQTDGKIVAAGLASMPATGYDFAVARYNASGTLDANFDGDGRVTTDFGTLEDRAYGLALQADGKIVAGGHTQSDFALARYNINGSLDTGFDSDGRVTTDFGGILDHGRGVAIQPDGKIVAAGYAGGANIALVRYNADGSPDATFGNGGLVTTDIAGSNDGAYAVALQADGKIVLAGGAYTQADDGNWQRDFAVARYLADGSLDAGMALLSESAT